MRARLLPRGGSRVDVEQIRRTVLAAIGAIAPEADLQRIPAGQPLREHVDLDSMDWINVIGGLEQRLSLDIPESDFREFATLDSTVAYLARRLAQPPGGAARAITPGPELPRATHRLDGADVTVRPVRPDDAPLEADFVRHLSNESRYKRFMVTLRELPTKKLRYLTDVDQDRHVALAATIEREGRPALIGVARYVVDPAGTGCEFAIAVDDAWQRSGIAGILMHALIDVARARGLAQMEGVVLRTNSRMLKFTQQLGFRAERDPEDPGTVRVVRAL